MRTLFALCLLAFTGSTVAAPYAWRAMDEPIETSLFRDGFDVEAACPAGRVITTKLAHRYDIADATVRNVTNADNIFGTFTDPNNPTAFPWDQGYTVFVAVRRAEYVSAAFVVPADTPANQHGVIYKAETVPGPQNIVSISHRCGDFAPEAPNCAALSGGPGQAILAYKMAGSIGAGCELEPGGRYYLNIELADPDAVDQWCGPVTCRYTLQNNHTP